MSGPFYYVLLYIQLMILKKVLVNILNRISCEFSVIFEILLGIAILYICYLTTNYTNIFDVYGGGGKLFGGTYLFIFYLGMVFRKHEAFDKISLKKSLTFSIIFTIAYYFWWRFMCINSFKLDASLPFGSGFNPPSISILLFAMITLCLAYGVFTLLEGNKYTAVILNIIAWIGKHTLYIFLYHRFFLDFILSKYIIEDINLKRIIYFLIMILGSIAIEYLIVYFKKILQDKNVVKTEYLLNKSLMKIGNKNENNAK